MDDGPSAAHTITPRRYAALVLKSAWRTTRDIKAIADWAPFIIGILTVLGVVVGSITLSPLIALPSGAAFFTVLAYVRGGYSAWRDEARAAASGDGRLVQERAGFSRTIEGLETKLRDSANTIAKLEATAHDERLHLQIERLVRSGQDDVTWLIARCMNAGPRQIDDLTARIVDIDVWTSAGWKQVSVGSADYLRWDVAYDGLYARLPVGSKLEIAVASCGLHRSPYIHRFRRGPVPAGYDYVGPRRPDPNAQLHHAGSDWNLRPGGVRLTVAFEAPNRRTQDEILSFALASAKATPGNECLRWADNESMSKPGREPPLA
jgi:hypothetical protein